MSDFFHNFPDRYKRFPQAYELEAHEFSNECTCPRAMELIPADQSFFYIDVSQMVNEECQAGVPKTVRSLIKALRINQSPFKLFKFEKLTGQPMLLTNQEEERVFRIKGRKSFDNGIAHSCSAIIKRYMPSFVWDMSKDLYSSWQRLTKYRSNRERKKGGCLYDFAVLDLRGCKVLVTEVAIERPRIEMIEILCLKYGIKTSAIVYDLAPVTHPEYCAIGYPFVHYLRIFRSIDSALCISKHTENELANFSQILGRQVPKKLEVHTFYLGGDLDVSTRDFTDSTSQHDVKNTERIVLMVARLEPRKNIRRVACAMAELLRSGEEFKFIIVGNPGWMQESIDADLERYMAEGLNMELYLSVSDEELGRWYQRSYFTVFCSLSEGLGLPIIESVLFGKPCLTSTLGAQSEVARALGGCLMVDPYNLFEIRAAVLIMLRNQLLYDDLARQARDAKWLTWSQYATQVAGHMEGL